MQSLKLDSSKTGRVTKKRRFPKSLPPKEYVKMIGNESKDFFESLTLQRSCKLTHWSENGIDLIIMCKDGWIPVHKAAVVTKCPKISLAASSGTQNKPEYFMLLDFHVSHALPILNFVYTGTMSFNFTEKHKVQYLCDVFGLSGDDKVSSASIKFVDAKESASCQKLVYFASDAKSPCYVKPPPPVQMIAEQPKAIARRAKATSVPAGALLFTERPHQLKPLIAFKKIMIHKGNQQIQKIAIYRRCPAAIRHPNMKMMAPQYVFWY